MEKQCRMNELATLVSLSLYFDVIHRLVCAMPAQVKQVFLVSTRQNYRTGDCNIKHEPKTKLYITTCLYDLETLLFLMFLKPAFI